MRPYTEADKARCQAIFDDCVSEFTWLNTPKPAPRIWADDRQKVTTWVADVEAGDSDRVIGFLMMSGRNAYVNYLLVERDWRLCGVGQGLVDVARDAAGVPLSLDVDEENTRALSAYRAMGFAPLRTERAEGRRLVRLESI